MCWHSWMTVATSLWIDGCVLTMQLDVNGDCIPQICLETSFISQYNKRMGIIRIAKEVKNRGHTSQYKSWLPGARGCLQLGRLRKTSKGRSLGGLCGLLLKQRFLVGWGSHDRRQGYYRRLGSEWRATVAGHAGLSPRQRTEAAGCERGCVIEKPGTTVADHSDLFG